MNRQLRRRPSARHDRRRPVVTGLLLLPLVLALAACASGTAAGADLAGRTFVSTEVRGHELVAGTQMRLVFDEESFSATAGCNTMLGGGTWDGGTLELDGEMASTLMACEPDLEQQDAWLAEFLRSSPALSLDGSTLELGDATTGITLTEEG